MPNEARPLSQGERRLVETLQRLVAGDHRLPAECEIEPGYFLRLVLDTWAVGGGRDGRKGHLTDIEIASELERRTGERFDRNRYQATFGQGKRMADGTRQPQLVKRPVANALLEIALKNWDAPVAGSGKRAPDETPIAQLPIGDLDCAIATALEAMYGDGENPSVEVRCRNVEGFGWKGLYEELGAGGFTVVVIARDDAIRMRDPKNDIFELSDMLNRLLHAKKSRAVEALHIWAIRRPKRQADHRVLVRQLDGIGTLKSKIKTIDVLNRVGSNRWAEVALKRCIVAEARSYSAHSDLFNLGVNDPKRSEVVQSEQPIAVLAISPDFDIRTFTFSLERKVGVAPFVEGIAPMGATRDKIVKLVKDARVASQNGSDPVRDEWRFYTALKFADDWDWQAQGDDDK